VRIGWGKERGNPRPKWGKDGENPPGERPWESKGSAGGKSVVNHMQLFPRLEDGWPIRLQVGKENAERAIEILTNLNQDNDPD